MERVIELLLVFNFAFCSAYFIDEKLKLRLDEAGRNFKSSERTFAQKLDHFDPNNQDTWPQRYWDTQSDNQSNDTALLFIHDPHTVSEMDIIDVQFLNPLAENLHAKRYYLEHRFYGQSKPKNDTNLTSLSYLSVEQALADIANFIEKIPNQDEDLVNNGVKWVVLGLSYGGTLATWARYKYPHLITYAVAINAPLQAQVDFSEYYQNVVNSLNSYNPACSERVASAVEMLKRNIENEETRRNIRKMFQLCDDMTEDPDDVSNLFAELAKNFAFALDFTGMSKSPRKNVSIQKLCDVMLNTSVSPLELYAAVNNIDLRSHQNPEQKCFHYRYDYTIEKLKNTTYNDDAKISRQWSYQLCTEFGFFPSSKHTSKIFGDFPATFFAKGCQRVFGSEKFNMAYLEKNVSSINKKYGGLEIDVNQTIFMYYSEDPWRSSFIRQNKTGSYEVVEITDNVSSHNKPELELKFGGFFKFIKALGSKLEIIEKKVGCELHGGDGC